MLGLRRGCPLKGRRFGKLALQNGDFDEDGLAFAFATLSEPSGQAFGEAFWGETITGFDAAVRDGKRVVEVGGVGEISHAELVEPVEGAGFFLAKDEDIDRELLGVHASILAVMGGFLDEWDLRCSYLDRGLQSTAKNGCLIKWVRWAQLAWGWGIS